MVHETTGDARDLLARADELEAEAHDRLAAAARLRAKARSVASDTTPPKTTLVPSDAWRARGWPVRAIEAALTAGELARTRVGRRVAVDEAEVEAWLRARGRRGRVRPAPAVVANDTIDSVEAAAKADAERRRAPKLTAEERTVPMFSEGGTR